MGSMAMESGQAKAYASKAPVMLSRVQAADVTTNTFSPIVRASTANTELTGISSVSNVTGVAAQGGQTMGLGLDADLALHRGTGAITYKGAGWQEAGLTKVDWGRASMDNFYFKHSFTEAARNAGAIKFNVSSFNPSYAKPGITNFEFNHIINNPSLLQKTTFIQNGNSVFWNGTGFIR